jgi:hypothetical protein
VKPTQGLNQNEKFDYFIGKKETSDSSQNMEQQMNLLTLVVTKISHAPTNNILFNITLLQFLLIQHSCSPFVNMKVTL